MKNATMINVPHHVRKKLKTLAVQYDLPMYRALEFSLDIVIETAQFLTMLEAVLDLDWDYTKEHLINQADNGTFLLPTDTQTNWSNYTELLLLYRALRTRLLPAEQSTYATALD